MPVRPLSRALVIGGSAAVLVLAGCGGGSKKPIATPSTSATPAPSSTAVTTSPAPSTTASTSTALTTDPFTGKGSVPKGPVFAVKIDDTENGRPQRGIDQADVVYIEEAEGGLTRAVGVFAASKPIVEAVRSVRASDAELLSQYGHITLVASGGGGDSLTTLDASIVKGNINDRGAPAFSRDGNRPAPYNLESNLTQLSSIAKTAGVKDIGFRFAASDPRLAAAKKASTINATVGSTAVTFRWSLTKGIYQRTISGTPLTAADGAPIGAQNVIVQFCQVKTNPNDVDVNGNPSKYTESVGSGTAVLFRNGKEIKGKWSRKSATSPTVFTDLNGKQLYQTPGHTYVLLAENGSALS